MKDLNDLYLFHQVVTYGGFAAAARAIGVPKSTLSKRVARLEQTLQVRLLERSTRVVRTTDLGQRYFEQCQAVVAAAEAADAVAAQAHAEPQGLVRVSCPQGLVPNLVADMLPAFMKAHPKVRVQLKVINRRVDLIEDRIDVALRARTKLDTDGSLVMRSLGPTHLVLAASRSFLESCAKPLTIERLADVPTLSMADQSEDVDVWVLVGPGDEERSIPLHPRLYCSNFDVLHAAAVAGLGVALLPEHVCRTSFASGQLVHALSEWRTTYGIIHAVFASRRGMLPAVRALIDFLAAEVPQKVSR
jgi:DNA-binding transcriptional LysR family regulator